MHHHVIVLRFFLFYEVLCRIQVTKTTDEGNTNDGITPITDDDWLHKIVPTNYDKSISPARFMNDKINGITINILPMSISDISEKNMLQSCIISITNMAHLIINIKNSREFLEYWKVPNRFYFEVELTILVTWKEPRLPFDEIQNRTSLMGVSPPREFQDRVWNPYLTFANCKFCEDQRRIAHNGIKHLEVWLTAFDKSIILYYSQTMKFSCHFNLHNYPLDSHECNIFIELLVIPNEIGFLFLKNGQFTNFSASHFVKKYIPAQYMLNDVVFANECSDLNPFQMNKPKNECIRLCFQFKRLIYNDLMLLYLPSFFIVVVSWLSFWMDVEASASRVALGLTSLLTLSTQFANGQKNLPPVSYIKALDVWMLTCSFMVFISLVEYFLSYQLKSWRMVSRIDNENLMSPIYRIFKKNHMKVRKMKRFEKKMETATTKVDYIARIIFPTSFLIFNIAYWSYYG